MCGASHFDERMDSFHKRKLQREEANEQNPYAVAIVKRTAGCTENQDGWPWGNPQHVQWKYQMHNYW